uniref:Reverse transcriptase domain-containing protein n=1 Tax=Tanacetum cinerariifolium TaxID=118510 RepID=A0A699K7Q0_TANCI|nr:reverse transcriptase domain-containing protein [Tanacetum cinerariifolium]
MFKQLHINITLADALILIPKHQKMLKALLSNKEKLLELANTPLNENCSAVILKKLPEKLRDPRKFLIPYSFSELKCKALADLANQAIFTPTGIGRDVFVPVAKFTFPANFVIVDYESDPRVPLILGRPFLRTARALIDVHREEMILRDDDIFDPKGGNVLIEKLLNLDSTKDLPPPHNTNPLSGSLNQLKLKSTKRNNDLPFDIESDLQEIEYLLNHDPIKDMDSILEDLIDESNLTDPNDNLDDTMPEIFTDEHALDYSSPPLYDEYDDDFDEF